MTPPERAVLATPEALDVCRSLQRAFIGPRALHALRVGDAARLRTADLRIALGLAWAAGDLDLVRLGLRSVPPDRVAIDPVLSAFKDAACVTPS